MIAQLRSENLYLRQKVEDLEQERKLLLDSVLNRHGVRELAALPEPQPMVQSLLPQQELIKKSLEEELEELRLMADAEPDLYGPLYQETILRYREQLTQ